MLLGVGFGFDDVIAKRVELLCQFVPTAMKIAYLSGGPFWLAFRMETNRDSGSG